MGDAKRGNNVESSFFEELVKQDFYQGSTKTASYEGGMSKDAAKSMLDSFSADQLEALAEEFDNILGKQASTENTLEDSILDDGEEKLAEDEKEDSPKDKAEDKKEGESPDEDKKEDSKKKLPPFMMKGKEKGEDSEKEEKEPKEKEAEEIDEDILKEAADKALELLGEKNLTLEDYAYSRIQDEKIASFVADKGEKLAVIMDMNPLLVIDDIVNSIEAQISAEE